MGDVKPRQGYFSLLRWISDRTRDEAKNVGIVLVEPESGYSAVRSAPVSTVSPRLHDQGLLDELLVQLDLRMAEAGERGPELLQNLHESLTQSLVLTEPRPVAVTDGEAEMKALYRAYLATRGGGTRVLTKAALLDRVVDAYRSSGRKVRRSTYIDDFIFDVILDDQQGTPGVVEVLSFASPRKDWTPMEKDAGHFLYAVEALDVTPFAVLHPPDSGTNGGAAESFERVSRWLKRADVEHRTLEEIQPTQLSAL